MAKVLATQSMTIHFVEELINFVCKLLSSLEECTYSCKFFLQWGNILCPEGLRCILFTLVCRLSPTKTFNSLSVWRDRWASAKHASHLNLSLDFGIPSCRIGLAHKTSHSSHLFPRYPSPPHTQLSVTSPLIAHSPSSLLSAGNCLLCLVKL